MLTRPKLSDGFEAANVACDEGEDGDAYASLYENADVGVLEKSRCNASFGRNWFEEIFIVSSSQMSPHHEQ